MSCWGPCTVLRALKRRKRETGERKPERWQPGKDSLPAMRREEEGPQPQAIQTARRPDQARELPPPEPPGGPHTPPAILAQWAPGRAPGLRKQKGTGLGCWKPPSLRPLVLITKTHTLGEAYSGVLFVLTIL